MSNPFELFGLEPTYAMDLKALDAAYFELQRQYHPDKSTQTTHNDHDSALLSSDINAAYQTLKNPVSRAAALLEIIGIPIPGADGESISNDTALLDIFEFQETISLCETSEQAHDIKEELDELLGEEQHAFSEHFDRGDTEALSEIYIKLSYMAKLRKQIDEVEQLFFKRNPLLH